MRWCDGCHFLGLMVGIEGDFMALVSLVSLASEC